MKKKSVGNEGKSPLGHLLLLLNFRESVILTSLFTLVVSWQTHRSFVGGMPADILALISAEAFVKLDLIVQFLSLLSG